LPRDKFDEVLSEAQRLSEEFLSIRKSAQFCRAPQLIYQEPPEYISRILSFQNDYIDEIITDDKEIYDNINKYIPAEDLKKVRLYEDDMFALYKLYDIEKQLRDALSKKIWLKCGGYIVIEQTEALTSIDVNSGKCVSKKSGAEAKENTVYRVNCEAAQEIARQLRIRNLSGIIIIDFINMDSEEHNASLLSQIRELFREDRITTSLIDITKLGLAEVTRKRTGETLAESMKLQN
jgi:ribonuclease G